MKISEYYQVFADKCPHFLVEPLKNCLLQSAGVRGGVQQARFRESLAA